MLCQKILCGNVIEQNIRGTDYTKDTESGHFKILFVKRHGKRKEWKDRQDKTSQLVDFLIFFRSLVSPSISHTSSNHFESYLKIISMVAWELA